MKDLFLSESTKKFIRKYILPLVEEKKPKSSPWFKSDYLILLKNSEDYIKMADLAFKNQIYSQVLHNGHIAVELVIKAAISKERGKHPKGHEILFLVNSEIKGKLLLKEINSDENIQVYFSTIYAAWDMQLGHAV